ncbi:hypothetical protein ATER59S_02225 [Aquamicrobium terrae]
MDTTITPVTAELWPDFEDLFGKQGACYGCWCTHFRQAPAVRRQNDRERNKDHIRARIEAGPPPGLLAFEEGRAVGWMQVGPRADVPEWNNAGRGSAPVDPADAADPGVWAVDFHQELTRDFRRELTRLSGMFRFGGGGQGPTFPLRGFGFMR